MNTQQPAGLSRHEIEKISKVLVIQLGPFGDGLLTTAYFEALKSQLPQLELHYLIKEPYHRIVLRHPFIDRLHTIPQGRGLRYLLQRIKTILTVRKERYDLVIDQQNKHSSRYITFLSGAPFRLGYSSGLLQFAYNIKTPKGANTYAASSRFSILAPLGIQRQPYRLYFPIPEPAQASIDQWLAEHSLGCGNFIVISPGSRMSWNQWSVASYADVADRIQRQLGIKVVLLWAESEKIDVMRVAELMATPALLAPPTTLEGAAALIKRCRLLLCNDSGLNHLAVTTATCTLAIFGRADPQRWSPASEFPHHHHLHVPEHERSAQHSLGIAPYQVFERLCAILDATAVVSWTVSQPSGCWASVSSSRQRPPFAANPVQRNCSDHPPKSRQYSGRAISPR